MANHNRGGRNVTMSDDQRPSWRPQDQTLRDDRDDERSLSDRDRRDQQDEGYRMAERYGQGQSGYASGRYGEDRPLGFENRSHGYGRYEDRPHQGTGIDDRFYGQRGYGGGDRGGYGGHGDSRGNEGRYGMQGPGQGRSGGSAPQAGTFGGSVGNRGLGGSQSLRGPHRGKGPQGWQRSDDRIRDMICETLTDDDQVDATNIEVTVTGGEVTLTGTVPDRQTKRMAEDIVDRVSGVKDVQNQLKIDPPDRGTQTPGRGAGKNDPEPSKHRA